MSRRSIIDELKGAEFTEMMEFGEPDEHGNRARMMRLGDANANITEYMTCNICESTIDGKFVIELLLGMPIKNKMIARIIGSIEEMEVIHLILDKCIAIAKEQAEKKGDDDADSGEGTKRPSTSYPGTVE